MSGSRIYQRASLAGLINAVSGKGLALVNLWLWNRLLLHHEFGEFIFALTIIEILAIVATVGLDQGLIFRLTRAGDGGGAREFAGRSLGVALAAGLVMALGITALGGISGGFLKFWIPALSLAVPIKAAAFVVAGWRRGRSQVASAIFLEQSLPAAIKTVLLAGAVFLSMGTRAVIVAEIAAPALALLPFWFQDRLNPFAAIRRRFSDLNFRYCLDLLGTRLLQRALERSDVVMLGLLATTAVVADYAVASRLAIIVLFAHDILNGAFTIRAGELLGAGKTNEANREYRRVQVTATAGALGAAAALGGFGGIVMGFFGDYRNAYPILLILILAHLAKVCFGPGGNYLKMAGHSGAAVLVSVAVLGLNVLLNLWFIPLRAADGAAWATFLSMLITNLLATWLIWRVARFSAMTIPIAIALATCCAVTFAGVTCGIPPIYVLICFLALSLIFSFGGRKSIQELLVHRHEAR